jgi:hypothetical protein
MPPAAAPTPPDSLRALLAAHGAAAVARFERFVADTSQPCAYLSSERVAKQPLRRSFLARALRAQSAAPVLGLTASKFGGVPYTTAANPVLSGHRFLGQINLAEVPHLPPGLPRDGILAVDLTRETAIARFARVRFYPRVEPRDAADDPGPIASVGAWSAMANC